MRLSDQEQHDQHPKGHQLQVRNETSGRLQPEKAEQAVEKNGKQHDEGRTEQTAHNRAQAADDDHEQQLEREINIERGRLPGSEMNEGPECARDADNEAAHGERGQLGTHRRNSDHAGRHIHVARGHPFATLTATHQVFDE